VARGEEVSFDGISVSDEGLHQPGDRFLPWHKVEEVRLEKTSIVVWKRKRRLNWCLIPRYKVANLKVFLAIVDQYTKESLERAPG
jgi:hypothetical protein